MEFIKKKWKLSKKSGNYQKKMNILSKKNITEILLLQRKIQVNIKLTHNTQH